MLRPEVAHLTEQKLDELYGRYLAGERVSELYAEYGIAVSPSSLVRVLPPVLLEGVYCTYCDLPMYERRKSRSAFRADVTVGFCNACDHVHYSGHAGNGRCGCRPCLEIFKQESILREHRFRETIRDYWSAKLGEPISYATLSAEEKVYTLALINAQGDLDLDIVLSVGERHHDVWFSPSDVHEDEALRLLRRRGVICVDPCSPSSAFASESVSSAMVSRVRWIVNVAVEDKHRSALEKIQRRIIEGISVEFYVAQDQAIKALAKTILIEQAMRQIRYQCDRAGMPFGAEKRGRDVVGQLFSEYSLAVVCYFSYLSVNRAVDYYRNSNIGKMQASNDIPRKMLAYGARAKSENWDLSSKRYLTNDPRSEISKVVFDLLMGVQDGGVNKNIDEYFFCFPSE